MSAIFFSLGRRSEALAAVERAAVLDPLSAAIIVQLGNAREAVGRFDDALIAYERAIEIDPRMSHAYKRIGDIQAYGFGRLDKAVAWYERAAILDPGSADTMASLAELYWELGDLDEAGRWLSRAVSIGEGSTDTNSIAALLYLQLGELEAARKHAQLAGELAPSLLYLMRDHDVREGGYATARARYAEAFPHLLAKRLPKFNDLDAVAAMDPALVLQHTGEEQQAKALLDHVANLHPNSSDSTHGKCGILVLGCANSRYARREG